MGESQSQKRDCREVAKRYVLLIIGLFFSALGVAIAKKGELGVSPISSVSNVLYLKFTALSLGTWLIIWNCVLILGQVLLLRKQFSWIQLLQIPVSFLFGWFTNFGVWLISFFEADTYALQMAMVIIGTVVLGFGIALSVIADVIMNSGEAFVKVLSDTLHRDFGKIKIGFDIGCVIIAVVLSLIFFDFTVRETREGTLIAAIFTGIVVNVFRKFLEKPLERLLGES